MPEKYRYQSYVLVLDKQEEDIFSPSEIYHENSKLDPDISLPEFQKINEIRTNPDMIAIMAKAFKEYPGCQSIDLPLDVDLGDITLDQAIRYRRSVRNFTGEPINIEQLSALLLFSYGITGQFTYTLPYRKPEIQYLRAAPSAGGLYPIEIYPVVLNVTDLEPGIYHYNVKDHALSRLKSGDYKKIIPPLLSGQTFTEKCAVIFLLTALFKRTTIKYGERGYRFVMLDAGHIGQNMYLASVALELGCLAIGGFYERHLERILEIDGVEESLVYVLCVGKPSPENPGVPPTGDWK